MWQLKNSNCDKTQIVRKLKLKLWQNPKTHIVTKRKTQMVTKLKNSNPDNSISDKTLKKSFGKNNLTPQPPMRCTLGSILWSREVYQLGAEKWAESITWKYSTLHPAYYSLLICTLNTAHCTLYTGNCILHTKQCSLNIVHSTLHTNTSHRTLNTNTSHCTQQIALKT